MLHLLRILFLVVVGCLLVRAVVVISTGSTGNFEQFVVAVAGCLWILAAWRELRDVRLRTLKHNAH